MTNADMPFLVRRMRQEHRSLFSDMETPAPETEIELVLHRRRAAAVRRSRERRVQGTDAQPRLRLVLRDPAWP